MKGFLVILFILFTYSLLFPQIRYSTKINSSITINYGKMSSPDKNTIYYVYRRGDNNTPEERQIKFARSTDSGISFSETDITIPYGTFNSQNIEPTIVSTANSVIAYYSFDSSGTELYCLARSTDKGSTFTLKTYNFSFPYFFNFISDGFSKYYLKYFEHYLVSTDNGATFVSKPYNIPGSLEAATPQYLWSAKIQSDTIFVYRSTNDGSTFDLITSIPTTIADGTYFTYSAFGNELNITWVDEEWGATKLKMVNINGNTVSPVRTAGPIMLMGYNTAPYVFQTANKIFIQYNQKVCYTTDKGITWSRNSDQSAEAGPNYELIVADDTTFYTHSSEYLTGGFLNLWFRNSKWTDQPFSPLKNDTLITGNFLFIGAHPSVQTSNYRLQISSTSDFSSPVIDTLSNSDAIGININGRFVNDTRYYYRMRGEENTYMTQWSSNTFIYGTMVDVKENPTDLNKYFLCANYPNPFNPSTTIDFNISERSNVNLTIYNLQGEVVDVLLNKEMQPGKHKVEWNTANKNLASGIYFYKLKAGNQTETRKMILMK
ncbi:MAG TPA: T9SS type A sorting domain-containing protein [Ignavibacteriaceae bacterium]|nr:T9SS type A sorting domain-containing protein [Ignavibacteriaceae bacterium]